MKITKETTLSKVLELKNVEGILSKYNVPCMGCPMMGMEMNTLKLGQICEMYGIDLEGLLKELNEL